MERTKILSIDKIWDGTNLKIRNFSNLDLEGLDLSEIPSQAWKNVKFYNTSVKNTKINLSLSWLLEPESYIFDKQTIKNCDFSYNDLGKSNVHSSYLHFPTFENCNFSNTNFPKIIYGKNNILDESCTEYTPDYNLGYLDLETIKNNPQLNVGIKDILLANMERIGNDRGNSAYNIQNIDILFKEFEQNDEEYKKSYLEELEKLLDLDKTKELIRLYNALLPLSYKQKFAFFLGYIIDYDFTNKKLVNIPNSLKNFIRFYNCKFSQTEINFNFSEMNDFGPYAIKTAYNYIDSFIMPHLSIEDWINNKIIRRFSNTPLTFRTNLYLELDRICNCHCEFCRNQTYKHAHYNVKKINDGLKKLTPYVDAVIIGGGEPTLRIKDIAKLYNLNEFSDKFIFTNSSCKDIDKKLEEITDCDFDYYISRHHFNDDINAEIFGVEKTKLMSTLELVNFISRNNVTLSATCFNGGLDTKEKIIEYIKYCISIGCKNILISDLQQNQSLNNKRCIITSNIDKNIFYEVMECLKLSGYKENYPIYSSGGYLSTVFKCNDITIAFKHYITLEELEYYWPRAMKRTFDLSMDPSGKIYENWHQKNGLVRTLTKK